MTPLFVDTAALLQAHQLKPGWRKESGKTTWVCETCDVAFDADEARHGVAEARHQAAILSVVEPSEQLPIGGDKT